MELLIIILRHYSVVFFGFLFKNGIPFYFVIVQLTNCIRFRQ
ncbi:putative membrane protein [Proteus mirabilis]|nr:hypothetical protein HMPREF3203_00699 [Proteus mirabilis]PVF71119.1 putative membrane protein [Proteus mirabilis]